MLSKRVDAVSSGPIERKLLFGVEPHDVAQIQTYWGRRLSLRFPRVGNLDGVGPEIGKAQLAPEQAAIRVRVGAPGGFRLADILSPQEFSRLDDYWRAANYLSVGQIYLLDNALLRESLKPEHIKPRLLGHWGTTPGLNFLYVHLNRTIKAWDLNVIYICGPGHGASAMVANAYLEGTYSEIYSSIGQDAEGMRRLF
jgi:hypothetical protein